MSTTTLQESIPINITAVKCKDYGYAWTVKDLCLVGQSNTKEDIPKDVQKNVDDFLKVLSLYYLKLYCTKIMSRSGLTVSH